MTLLSVYNSEGCVGRCDARCYGAKHAGCDCVCGGRNHAKGKKLAIENTITHGDDWAREFARAGQQVFRLGDAAEQIRMFG